MQASAATKFLERENKGDEKKLQQHNKKQKSKKPHPRHLARGLLPPKPPRSVDRRGSPSPSEPFRHFGPLMAASPGPVPTTIAPLAAVVDLDVEAVPDMASLLTVILTTSPTPSAPCTDLLSAVLASFRVHCPALLTCPVTVVFDTYDRVVPRARLKKGSVTAEEAKSYVAYKDNVRRLVRDVWAPGSDSGSGGISGGSTVSSGLAEYGSPFIADNAVAFTTTRSADGRIAFIEPAARLGFGLAVRTAVRAATTPYVWIQQHDWTLVSDIPLAAMLEVMGTCETRADEQAQRQKTDHREAVAGQEELEEEEEEEERPDERAARSPSPGGSDSQDTASVVSSCADPEEEAVPVRYICMPSIRMLRYATSPHVVNFPNLRSLTVSLKSEFAVSADPISSASARPSASSPAVAGHGRLPLTPLFFWHDKTHLASTAHYLQRVFSSRLAIGRGDFIEDHIGQRARTQMKNDPAMWRNWACWLYYPDDGNQLCLRHLQGRTWRGESKEREMRDMYRERNRSAAKAAAEASKAAAAVMMASPRPSFLMECTPDDFGNEEPTQ